MVEKLTPERAMKIARDNCWFAQVAMESLREMLESGKYVFYREGKGIYLRDIEGKEYLDATSTGMCCTLGVSNQRVIEAIKEQLDTLAFSRQGHSEVGLLASERLVQISPPGLNRVVLSLSGSNAVGKSLVIARQHFRTQGKPNHIIISQFGAFHGISADAAGATGIPELKQSLGRNIGEQDAGFSYILPPYCYRCPYGLEYPRCNIKCATILDEVIRSLGPNNVAAFIGEPVFAIGGMAPPLEYWPIIKEICDKYGILFIFDEIVTGFGRLGKLWASELFNIVPDMMVLGKGMSAAYVPLSAVVMHDRVFEPFTMKGAQAPLLVHTHSYYPLGCAATIATIDEIMEKKLWENAAKVGAHINKRLNDIAQKSKIVGTIHGVGLMQGVEIVEDKQSKTKAPYLTDAIRQRCEEKGLIMIIEGTPANLLCIYPPLIITEEESDKICDILGEAIEEIEAERK